VDTVVALELDSSALTLPALPVPALVSLTTKAKATASNVFQGRSEFGPDKAVDGNHETRWATDTGTKSSWLEVDLGKPASFSRAIIRQAYPELIRVRQYAIEYWQDGHWKTCHQGGELAAVLSVKFTPVSAQRVRLNILEASDGPTICEFGLYE
jgi:alpha-L-fucosidase